VADPLDAIESEAFSVPRLPLRFVPHLDGKRQTIDYARVVTAIQGDRFLFVAANEAACGCVLDECAGLLNGKICPHRS
jgi:hypothetical protein